MTAKNLISVVIPCYNEEQNLPLLMERIHKILAPYRSRYDFEFLATDNCSQDGTLNLLKSFAASDKNFRVLKFSRNIGADRAIFAAMGFAKGDAMILIQSDLQDPPELIADFINGWEQGYDVVYGVIKKRDEGLVLRGCKSLYYKLVAALSDVEIPRNATEFRLMSRRALDALLCFREYDLYIRAAVAQVGFRQKQIPYDRAPRHAGTSSVNFMYLVGYAINGFLSTTVVPIRFVTFMGFGISAFGFLMSAWIVISKFIIQHGAPQGYTTTASLLTFFAGVQILALGIIGEYIRKIYLQTLNRPIGFLDETSNIEVEKGARL